MQKNEKLVFDKEFKEELLSELNELRKENILCDVTLRIEGQDFPAHICVLSAASPYFRSLFTGGFKENESNVVELQEIKPAAVASEALRFIYTGDALITDATTAQDLFKMADYLIIPSLKTKVSDYLKESIDATNCLALESLAVQFGCESLQQVATTFKLKNFVSVVKSEDFMELDFEKVKELVSHDEIIVSKEEDVYGAVIKWVKHDTQSRECLFPELLKCLRLFSMSKYSLWEILKEEMVMKSMTGTSLVHEGIAFALFPDTFLGMSLKPRECLNSNESVIVLTGGHNETTGPGTSNTNCLLLSTNCWVSLPGMPVPRTRHGAAVCCGQLFVMGGKSSDPMCSFNPKLNKWITDVTQLRTLLECSVTAFNGELYLIGGENHWKNIDKYDPSLKEWKRVPSMKTRRAAHCAVAMGKLIYVLGGDDGEVCLKSVECFDPSAKQWSDKPSLISARRFAGAAATYGKVFVVGGYSDMVCSILQASCEMFDPELDQWSLVSSPVVPRAACALVSFDDHLYLFGGEQVGGTKLDSVERYDVQNNKWGLFSTMPEKLACVQASVMLLPKKYIHV